MAKKRKRPRRCVLGYPQWSERTVWGQQHFLPPSHPDHRLDDYCELMTITEARAAVDPDNDLVIFELVPVK